MSVSLFEEQRVAMARMLGVDPEEIRVGGAAWSRLLKQGVIVKVRIGYLRGRTKLTAEDLGLEEDPAAQEVVLMELGKKCLIPKWILDRAKAIDSRARDSLEKCSFQTAFGRFVPVRAYRAWREKWEELRAEFLALRDEVADSYQEIKQQVESWYEEAARKAYFRLSRVAPPAEGEDAWVARYMGRIRELFPSRERLIRSFVFEHSIIFLPSPSELEEELRRQEEIAQQRELQRAEFEAKRQAFREYQENLDNFLRDCLAQLRGQVYDVVTEVLAATRKHGQLQGASVLQLRNLVEQVRLLNFIDDVEVEDAVRRIESLLSRGPQGRTTEEVVEALQDIGVIARQALLQLGESPRSARSLGIPDEIPPELAEEARERLARRGIEAGELPLEFPEEVERRTARRAEVA